MKVSVAIAASGVLIAAAVLFVFRWDTVPGPRSSHTGEATVVRVDRWTGEIVSCEVRLTPGYSPGPGNVLECSR